MYLQGAGMRGFFCVLQLDVNEHCASEGEKILQLFLGWNISKNVEMIFDLFDNSD